MLHTRTIHMTMTALDPIVHGAGTEGNTQLLRTQEVLVTVAGKPRRVRLPFVSGNSLKHRIRAAAAVYAIKAMGVEKSFTKAMVDLLLSGGSLSKSGTAIDLSAARKISELMPVLSLCGYSAGNTMTESKISVSNLHVVCRENEWRMPAALRNDPMALLDSSGVMIEEFGTRHDQGGSQIGQKLLSGEAYDALVGKKTKLLKGKEKGGAKDKTEKSDSAQMIYTYQAIAAGARLWGTIDVAELTPLEMFALRSAFYTMSVGMDGAEYLMHLGAKNSVGHGRVRVEFSTEIRIPMPEMQADASSLATLGDTDQGAYNSHLRDNAEEILRVLREATS